MKTRTLFFKMPALIWLCIGLLLSMPARAEAIDTNKNTLKENTLGRLFSQPIERLTLDNLRKNHALQAPKMRMQKNIVIPNDYSPTLPQPITLQGYVKRSDGGKSTLWINDKPVQENSMVDDVKIGRLTKGGESAKGKTTSKQVERLDILIPANNKHVQLRAGQRYEPESNRVKEVTTIAKEKQLQLEASEDEAAAE